MFGVTNHESLTKRYNKLADSKAVLISDVQSAVDGTTASIEELTMQMHSLKGLLIAVKSA